MIRFARTILLVATLCGGCARARPPAAEHPRPSARAPAPRAGALFARGMQYANAGDALRAEQYLVMAMNAGYPRERVIVPLVRVCIASARLRTALAHAQSYLRTHPDAWQLRYLTAAIHLALGAALAARDDLTRVLRVRPDAAQAHYLLGVTLRDALHDPDAARASFAAYLHHAPDGVHAAEVVAWLTEHDARAAASVRRPRPRAVREAP